MRVAVTGASGQLGSALGAALALSHEVVPLSHHQLELGSAETVARVVATGADLVIHTAAYTNVDGCTRDPRHAYQINALGTRFVALACRRLAVPLVYISTNEVFAGTARSPYFEYAPTAPINAYGHAKLAGELAVREVLSDFYIVRVAWLFGGARNFVRTILRLAANPPADGLRMVADEVGNPTYAVDVAEAIANLIGTGDFFGTYHFVNDGAASRYTFARTILDLTGYAQLPITPITLAEYVRESTPPTYTPLANVSGAALGISLRPWQEALGAYLATLGF